jgi:hypothetical protein
MQLYLACVYYIIATLATVGYGDIAAEHMNERMVAIGIMLMGTIVFALIISTASMVVQSSNFDDAAHGAKISMVHNFCDTWNIHESLKYDILDFFMSSKEVFCESTNNAAVLKSLPPNYQCMVAPHVAKDCISRTVLFKACTPQFLSLLLECMSLESYDAGDAVFEAGDVSHSFYIIKSGICLLVGRGDVVAAELVETDIIGEVSCFMSTPRSYTCVCSKFCELYVLSSQNLAKIFQLFPDFRVSFGDYCRRKKLIDLYTKHRLSSACSTASQPPFSSRSGGTRSPLPSPAQPLLKHELNDSAPKATLSPLPKGKYRSLHVRAVPELLQERAARFSPEERIRLVSEIQVKLLSLQFMFMFCH